MSKYFIYTDRETHIYRVRSHPFASGVGCVVDTYIHKDKIINGATEDMIENMAHAKIGPFRRHVSYVEVSPDEFCHLQLGTQTGSECGFGLLACIGVCTLDNSCATACKKTSGTALMPVHNIRWFRMSNNYYQSLPEHERKILQVWLKSV